MCQCDNIAVSWSLIPGVLHMARSLSQLLTTAETERKSLSTIPRSNPTQSFIPLRQSRAALRMKWWKHKFGHRKVHYHACPRTPLTPVKLEKHQMSPLSLGKHLSSTDHTLNYLAWNPRSAGDTRACILITDAVPAGLFKVLCSSDSFPTETRTVAQEMGDTILQR